MLYQLLGDPLLRLAYPPDDRVATPAAAGNQAVTR